MQFTISRWNYEWVWLFFGYLTISNLTFSWVLPTGVGGGAAGGAVAQPEWGRRGHAPCRNKLAKILLEFHFNFQLLENKRKQQSDSIWHQWLTTPLTGPSRTNFLASLSAKVLMWWKSGQNPIKSRQNLWKPSKTPWKSEQKWCPPCFDLNVMAPELTWRAFFIFWRTLFWSDFRTSLGESGQNSFAPLKICLLLHLWLYLIYLYFLICKGSSGLRGLTRLQPGAPTI